ncbi:MAG: histidine kinase [Eubacteriales bacterium]|nr:histidine kinase [Eubacteriales bacterium]
MKKFLRTLSLRKLTLLFLLLILTFLFLVISYYNTAALRILRNRVYRNTQDTAVLYEKQIDKELSRLDAWLYTLLTENGSFISLSYLQESDWDFYPAVQTLNRYFSNSLSDYEANALFCYLPGSDLYIAALANNEVYASMRQVSRTAIEQQARPSHWNLVRSGDVFYLIKYLKSGERYIGAVVSIDTLLRSVTNGDDERSSVYLSDDSGQLLENIASPVTITLPGADSYSIDRIDGERMIIVAQPLDAGPYSLIRTVPYAEISYLRSSLAYVFIPTVLFVFLLWLGMALFFQLNVLRPVTAITNALRELSAGNLDNRITEVHQLPEFRTMTDTYNNMVSEIKNLKIDVYEQKLLRSDLEVQFLKQQITPHFMINCLNTAYQLTDCNELKLAQDMLRSLSNHLRYVLSSGQTVSLREELSLVENYIRLSSIRYPNSLSLSLSCPKEAEDAVVVPLMILNFVENSVKYSVSMGQLLEIFIEVSALPSDLPASSSPSCLRIVLWDNGKGYSEEVLQLFQNFSRTFESTGGHIGIANTLRRTRQIFDTASFSFCNRPGAGAQITITIPYEVYRL